MALSSFLNLRLNYSHVTPPSNQRASIRTHDLTTHNEDESRARAAVVISYWDVLRTKNREGSRTSSVEDYDSRWGGSTGAEVTYREDDSRKLRPELVEVRCGWCQHRYPNRTPGLVAFVLVILHADDYWKILALGRSGKATTTALFVRIVHLSGGPEESHHFFPMMGRTVISGHLGNVGSREASWSLPCWRCRRVTTLSRESISAEAASLSGAPIWTEAGGQKALRPGAKANIPQHRRDFLWWTGGAA